ncbi:MAG: hypothetical protein ACR2NN_24930 [Bryobacteraceae bacterium]
MRTITVVMLIMAAPQTMDPRQTGPRVKGEASHCPQTTLPSSISHAIHLSAAYLERACSATGKFTYRVDTTTGRVAANYNFIRHEGAMYALSMFNRSHPDRRAVNAMIRAASFLRTEYIGTGNQSNMLVVWSQPVAVRSDAALGAAGLGLVALAETERVQPKTIPLDQLRALGRFIIFLQKPDGSFYSRYRADLGPDGGWQSLYYTGEATLGLIALYEVEHSREWLIAAGKALSYLARSRVSIQEPPPDHWALIATARFLPYYEKSSCPASRKELLTHAARICEGFLGQQRMLTQDATLSGSFDPEGRTTPTATRLEGLLAALEFLPEDTAGQRARIERAIRPAIAFLLRAQIASGQYAGEIPRALVRAVGGEPRAQEVRIDYVQHALCAWLRFQAWVSTPPPMLKPVK